MREEDFDKGEYMVLVATAAPAPEEQPEHVFRFLGDGVYWETAGDSDDVSPSLSFEFPENDGTTTKGVQWS